jgi:hypothetical protein
MAAVEPHPGPEILSDYALGRLVDGEFVAVAEHVDRCDECQETLSFLSLPDDTMVRGLKGDAPIDPFGEEPECAAAVAAIEHGFVSHDEPCSTLGLYAAATRTDDNAPLATIRDYELLAPLGRGGMGVVYRARHMRLDRLVAVKVLPAERMRQPQAVARFHREMKALGNLDHPHIVRAYDAGEAEGKHFLAMELIDGVDLGSLAEREGPLAVADACELVRQAALGLDYAHRNGLVHRDVKPSNLMLDRTGTVKVLDLGLARLLEESEVDGDERAKPQAAGGSEFQVLSSELTGADQAMGTPDYMAPEQCTHCHAADARTDVYSLGATLYRLLAGCAPYSGERYDTVAKKIAGLTGEPVPPLGEHRRDLPSAVVALVQRMLAKDVAQRVSTPGEVAMQLTPFCRGQRVVDLASGRAKPQAAGDAGRRWRRWAVAVAAAGAVAWLAPVLARVMTPYGELVVEVAEEARDDVTIQVRRGSEVHILGEKPEARWSIELKDGAWDVKLNDSTNQYEIDADTVTMSRGHREVVSVTLKRPNEDHPDNRVGPPLVASGPGPSTPRLGQWNLRLPSGDERVVAITSAGEHRVDMHLGDLLGGQYVWNGRRLVVERPDDARYAGLAWIWDGEELVLIHEPPSHPAGPSYVGARLTWIAPNSPTAQPREHLGETEETRLAILDSRDPRTGHLYRRGNVPMSWHQARDYCEQQGGHLATIESAEENEFLYQTFARDQACWLGATCEVRDRQWRWVTDEPMSYTNWFRDESDFNQRADGDQGDQHYVAFGNRVWLRGGRINFHFDGYWASIPASGQQSRLAFVLPLCEWEPGEEPEDGAAGADSQTPAPQAKPEPTERFELSSTWPIDRVDGFERVTVDGETAWKFDVSSPGTIELFTRQRTFKGKAIVKFSAEVRSENLKGRAALVLRANYGTNPKAVTQSPSIPYTKSDGVWTHMEAPMLMPDDPGESTLRLNLVVEGTGAVMVRNAQLDVRELDAAAPHSNPASP